MKTLCIPAAGVILASLCAAGPTERAIVAAMKVSELPNYSWTTTVVDDARTYDIDGKTVRGSYTWLRLPMVKQIAQRLGREADAVVEAFFRDRDTSVIRTAHGWKTLRELPPRNWGWQEEVEFWPLPAHGRGGMAAAALSGLDPLDLQPIIVPLPPPAGSDDRRPYSNAQFALSHPHEDLGIIVSSFTGLEAGADMVVGRLSDLGAQLLLVRDGQEHIQTLAAGGAFKLHLKGGIVVKYLLRLEGLFLIDRKKVHVHQSSTTVLKNLGTTALVVPDDVRRKLGG